MPLLLFILFLTCHVSSFYLPGLPPVTYCVEADKDKDCQTDVSVFVNRLNSLKTAFPYKYMRFDLCQSNTSEQIPTENLGQVLLGDRIRPSSIKLKFKQDVSCAVMCEKTYKPYDKDSMSKLNFMRKSIELNYMQHWIIDNMPVTWCYLIEDGTTYCSRGFPLGCTVTKQGRQKDSCVMSAKFSEPNTYYFFNHVDLTIIYHPGDTEDWGKTVPNRGRIISAKVEVRSVKYDKAATSDQMCNNDNPMGIKGGELKEETTVRYTYSVQWKEDRNTKWSSRWDYILKGSHINIQWFSIMNTLVIALFLSGVLTVIMLRISRNNKADNSDYTQEELRWKLVCRDAFRPPRCGVLLAVLVGSGVQIFFAAFITLEFACFGFLSPANRGALMTCAILLYVCLGTPAGYCSARLYKTFGGEKQISTIFMVALLCPGIVFTIFFILNLVFWVEGSSAAIPFTALLFLLGLWFGISAPLTFLGAYFGFKKTAIQHPVETSECPRQIPKRKIWIKLLPGMVMGGVLPFGCIFMQLFFILNSIWAAQVYYNFGFLLLVFILLITTCAEATVLLCYYHLIAEDYHWWWRSFLTSGFTAVYVFIYCIYYYFTKLELQGAASALIYFGYSFIMAFCLFLLTGTIGFYACFWFVTKIYSGGCVREEKLNGLDISVEKTKPDKLSTPSIQLVLSNKIDTAI